MKIERKFFQAVVIVIFVGSRGYARPFDRMWVGNTLGHSEARACYVTPCLGSWLGPVPCRCVELIRPYISMLSGPLCWVTIHWHGLKKEHN